MLHFRREIDVQAIIAAVLAVRALARTNSDISSADFTLALGDAYRGWTAESIDTIADYVERDIRVARRFRSWRRRRVAHSVVTWAAVVRVYVRCASAAYRRPLARHAAARITGDGEGETDACDM